MSVIRPPLRLSFTEAGQGETILLLHGSAGSGALWRRYVDPLVAEGYRVVVPDLVGYGSTGAWPRGASLRLEDEIELLHPLLPPDGGRFHLVGYSYGGAVALAMAARHPAALTSLTLIEPVAFFVLRYASETAAYTEVSRIREAFLAELQAGNVEAALRGFLGYWTGPNSWDALPARAREEILNYADKIRLDWEASFDADPGVRALRAIQPRALLVHGGGSPLSTRRVAAALAEMLPHSTLRVVDEANHLLPLTHGPALMEALLAHLHTVAVATAGG